MLISLSVIALALVSAECGAVDDVKPRIIGGESTNIIVVPYQAAILMNNGSNFNLCGGVILSRTFVLTSARCVKTFRNSEIQVRVGSTYWKRGGEVYSVKYTSIHPSYRELYDKTADYDIALLQLASPMKFSANVEPIKIRFTKPLDGEIAIISGFGKTSENNVTFPSDLQSVEIPLVAASRCSEYFPPMGVTSQMGCLFKEEASSFMGDFGGPVAVRGELVGIMSWAGRSSCVRPNIYTDLTSSSVRKFIKKVALV